MSPEKRNEADGIEPVRDVDGYEPPKVESAVTADELAREIQYAGGISEL